MNQCLNENLETRNAAVAPSEEAKLTMIVPVARPKSAPPARVMTAAPGRERAVTIKYRQKYMNKVKKNLPMFLRMS